MSGVGDGAAGWDFFISYTKADQRWAEWVAWQLEAADYRVLIQAWDFVPGSDWRFKMEQGVTQAARTIAVLSKTYLSSVYGGEEWRAARAADPEGLARKLLPVRVENCDRPGVLRTVVSVDLFGVAPHTARLRLLAGVRGALNGRVKPEAEPEFPVGPGRMPRRSNRRRRPAGIPVHPGRMPPSQPAAFPDPHPSSPRPLTPRPIGNPLTGHTKGVRSVVFAPDGQTLATASVDQTVRLWDVADPSHARPIGNPLTGHTKGVWSVVFAPDGQTLATASTDQTVRLWDVWAD